MSNIVYIVKQAGSKMSRNEHLREVLEQLYLKYHRPEYIHPDPLEFPRRYPDPADREVVALLASSMAFGRVEQIMNSVEKVLLKMGKSPAGYVLKKGGMAGDFNGFCHRWVDGSQVDGLLAGIRGVLEAHGTLNNCMVEHMREGDGTINAGLSGLAGEIRRHPGGNCHYLVPQPGLGSACKRLHLFLRWMVRNDEVDPGGWTGVLPGDLLVPLDTHMFRAGRLLGFTSRRTADFGAVLEITQGFRELSPLDPVRYDFSLTRLGIRKDASMEELF